LPLLNQWIKSCNSFKPTPGLPVLVAVFNHTNVYALHQLPSSQIGQLVLSMASFSGQATEEVWKMDRC
jgi:hypothetical protein